MPKPIVVAGVLFLSLSALAPTGKCQGEAQVVLPEDKEIIAGTAKLPGLTLELVLPKSRYEQSEPIVATLRYRNTSPRALQIRLANSHRSNFFTGFGFQATDTNGQKVRDPLPPPKIIFGSGLWSFRPLDDNGYEQSAVVNEWLDFSEPGKYTLQAYSDLVNFNTSGYFGHSIPLDSAPVELEIVPPVEEHRLARLNADRAALAANTTETAARLTALQDLRWLKDERGIPSLTPSLELAVEAHSAYQALEGLPDLKPVKTALLARLNDPKPLNLAQSSYFTGLLNLTDIRELGLNPDDPKTYVAVATKQKQLIREKFSRDSQDLPPRQRAEATLEGMAVAGFDLNDAANWKLVLTEAPRMSQNSQLRLASLLEPRQENYPLDASGLRVIAANKGLNSRLRTFALAQLGYARMDDSLRKLVLADILSPRPVLGRAAHATLGSGRQDVADGLLKLMHAPDGPDAPFRVDVAERLRDLGGAVTTQQWLEILDWVKSRDGQTPLPLMEGLALKSPASAVPFLLERIQLPAKGDYWTGSWEARVLARLNTPGATAAMKKLLNDPDERLQRLMLDGIYNAAVESSPAMRFDGSRALLPPADRNLALVPAIRELIQNTNSDPVRKAAKSVLQAITREKVD